MILSWVEHYYEIDYYLPILIAFHHHHFNILRLHPYLLPLSRSISNCLCFFKNYI